MILFLDSIKLNPRNRNTDIKMILFVLIDSVLNSGSMDTVMSFTVCVSMKSVPSPSILIVCSSFGSVSGNKAYWINYDSLKSFIKNNNTLWKVSEKKYIHVIAWKLFSSKPNFSGVKQKY